MTDKFCTLTRKHKKEMQSFRKGSDRVRFPFHVGHCESNYKHAWVWSSKRAGRETMKWSPAIIQAVNKGLDSGRSNGDRQEGMAIACVGARLVGRT